MPTSRSRLLAALAVAVATACVGGRQPLLHHAHREVYAIQPAELEKIQLYVSEDVLAHELGGSGPLEGPEHVYTLSKGTRGVVTEAGADWLRVSFGVGNGAIFLANATARPDSVYMLASDPENGARPTLVREDPNKVLRVGGRRFQVLYGSGARLLIDSGDLEDLKKRRPTLPGREVK